MKYSKYIYIYTSIAPWATDSSFQSLSLFSRRWRKRIWTHKGHTHAHKKVIIGCLFFYSPSLSIYIFLCVYTDRIHRVEKRRREREDCIVSMKYNPSLIASRLSSLRYSVLVAVGLCRCRYILCLHCAIFRLIFSPLAHSLLLLYVISLTQKAASRRLSSRPHDAFPTSDKHNARIINTA